VFCFCAARGRVERARRTLVDKAVHTCERKADKLCVPRALRASVALAVGRRLRAPVSACVCLCVPETQREREKEGGKAQTDCGQRQAAGRAFGGRMVRATEA